MKETLQTKQFDVPVAQAKATRSLRTQTTADDNIVAMLEVVRLVSLNLTEEGYITVMGPSNWEFVGTARFGIEL